MLMALFNQNEIWQAFSTRYLVPKPVKSLKSRVYTGLYVNLYWQNSQLSTKGSARALATAWSEWPSFDTPCSGKIFIFGDFCCTIMKCVEIVEDIY